MRKDCGKMVLSLLNDDQKERRLQVCQDIIKRLQPEPHWLRRVITADETWIFQYDLETKRMSSLAVLAWSTGVKGQYSTSAGYGVVLAPFAPLSHYHKL